MVRVLLATSLAGLGLIVSPGTAGAWVPLGCRQPSAQVLIINNAPSSPINYAAIGVTAAAAWRFSGSHVNTQMVPPGTWTINNYSAYAWGNTLWDGRTTWQNGCPNGIFSNPTNSWLNRTYTDGYGDGARQSVAVHELGHMLGLDHNNLTNCSVMPVMYFSTARWDTCFVNLPQVDDRNGVNSIY